MNAKRTCTSDFYHTFFNRPGFPSPPIHAPPQPSQIEPFPPITLQDVREVISSHLKKEKAADSSRMTADMHILSGAHTATAVFHIICEVADALTTAVADGRRPSSSPSSRLKANLISKDYRLICLQDTTVKIMAPSSNVLKQSSSPSSPPTRARTWSTPPPLIMSQPPTPHRTIHSPWRGPVHFAFLDLTQAFDSMHRQALWQILLVHFQAPRPPQLVALIPFPATLPRLRGESPLQAEYSDAFPLTRGQTRVHPLPPFHHIRYYVTKQGLQMLRTYYHLLTGPPSRFFMAPVLLYADDVRIGLKGYQEPKDSSSPRSTRGVPLVSQ